MPTPFRTLALCASLLAPALSAAPAEVLASLDSQGTLELSFAEPMLTWQEAATGPIVETSPSTDCTWHWEDENTLACFDPALPRATRIEIRTGEGLFTLAGRALAPTRHTVDTPTASVEARGTSWDASGPRFLLSPSRDVRTEGLSGWLDLRTAEGGSLGFTLEAPRDPDGYWTLTPAGVPADTAYIELWRLRGLPSSEGPLVPEHDAVLARARVNEPFTLSSVACGRSAVPAPGLRAECAPGGVLRLDFSLPLSPASIRRLADALPEGLTLVEPSPSGTRQTRSWARARQAEPLHRRPRWSLEVAVDVPSRDQVIRLPDGLEAETGEALASGVAFELATGPHPPQLRALPRRRVLAPGESLPPPLAINAGEARLQARFLDLYSAVGTGALDAGDLNEQVPVRLPPAPERLTATGGLAQFAVEGGDSWSVAYAAFNVVAFRTEDSILAWVLDWEGAEPVAGARVELLAAGDDGGEWSLKRIQATATSDAEGKVRFDLAGPLDPGLDWLLRAGAGGHRSVLPLAQALTGRQAARRLTGRDRVFWALSDRPLYRPGDHVSYRIWPREVRGSHLEAFALDEPLSVRLVPAWGTRRPVRSWSLAADGNGRLAGAVQLPEELPDDLYCFEIDGLQALEWTQPCFEVTRFDSSDTWTRVSVERDSVRPGETVAVRIQAGYHSGGAAVGAQVFEQALLLPESPASVWPEFAGFAFGDPDADRGLFGGRLPEPRVEDAPVFTDASGEATIGLPMRFADSDRVSLGRVLLSAEARLPGAFGSVSGPVELVYAGRERFVGLDVTPRWPRAGEAVALRAVVVDANGRRVPDAPVEVSIHVLDPDVQVGFDDPDHPDGEAVTRCRVGTQPSATACSFRFEAGTSYRFVARSGDAAPAVVARHTPDRDGGSRASVSLDWTGTQADDPRPTLRIRQPYEDARLFLVADHRRVLWNRTLRTSAAEVAVTVPVEAGWRPGTRIRVIAVNARRDARDPAAGDAPLQVGAEVFLPETTWPQPAGLGLEVAPELAPGQRATLTVSNPRDTPVEAVIAIIDEGLLSRLSPEAGDESIWPPASPATLSTGWWTAHWSSFLTWTRGPERMRLGTAFGPVPPPSGPPVVFSDAEAMPLDRVEVTGSRITASDLFPTGRSRDPDLPGVQTGAFAGPQGFRSRFAQTAYWNPGVRLAPGEVRELEIPLPDNLTRWRVIGWATTDGDDFSVAEASFTASLAVEARLQAPVRVFTGDTGVATATGRTRDAASMPLRLEASVAGDSVRVAGEQEPGEPAGSNLVVHLPVAGGAPTDTLTLTAEALGRDGRRDGVSRSVRVAADRVEDSQRQSGWMSGDTLSIPLPQPAGGAAPQPATLAVHVDRPDRLLIAGWLRDLRDYPHLCWEQRLARAIGAATWITEGGGLATAWTWPDADAVVPAVIDAAALHFDDQGLLAFFADSVNSDFPVRGDPVLNAWTLRALAFLGDRGHTAPDWLSEALLEGLDQAARALEARLDGPSRRPGDVEAAAVIAGSAPALFDRTRLQGLLGEWDGLSWFARARLVEAVIANGASRREARALLRRLHQAPLDRSIGEHATAATLGSAERDQCAVIEVLARHDASRSGRNATWARLRTLVDQQAGGTGPVDTQAAAQCLLAVAGALAGRLDGDVDAVRLSIDGVAVPGDGSRHRAMPLPEGAQRLHLQRHASGRVPLAVLAEVAFDTAASSAPERALGLSISRRYAVLSGNEWHAVDDRNGDAAVQVRPGDWVRVTLEVDAGAVRRFVAISDVVPGGLVPENPALPGVAGPALASLTDPGSHWFASRRLDDETVRLYAETLPPGRHRVHYYARAVHPGSYLAPGASAEIMYGRASYARSRPRTVQVMEPDTASEAQPPTDGGRH